MRKESLIMMLFPSAYNFGFHLVQFWISLLMSSDIKMWRGTGGREPGRTGGGRGWEAGKQGAGSGSRNKEGDSLLFITGYYSNKNAYLAKFWNFYFTCTNAQEEILEARKRKFVLELEKQLYFRWIWKSLQFDYAIGYEIAWHMTHVHLYFTVW